jgi:ABC-type transporter Mla subunit MlaD
VSDIATGIDRIDDRFATIDSGADARNDRLSTALGSLATHADTLAAALDRGGTSADTMIAKTETLMTALDATVREIDETLPAAFGRLDGTVGSSTAKIAEVAPQVATIEREASAALDRLLAAEKLLSDQRVALEGLGTALDARLNQARNAAKDLVSTVEGADNRARALADGAGATLVDAMVRVRETAMAAADRAREALSSIVPDSAERLSEAVKEAFGKSITEQVGAQIAELAATAEQSVAAANTASDRLMRQMLTIAETSAQVEARIFEAHAEMEEADRDNFTRRVALLIESLNSTAIDVTKLFSNDVTDSAWNAYLKGDRGVFTRRAVRLLDAGEAREIWRHYNDDPEFRDQVNRYVHDFEAMLRNVLATKAGSALGVTLLSSDMGKLYVALAQAIERLRT